MNYNVGDIINIKNNTFNDSSEAKFIINHKSPWVIIDRDKYSYSVCPISSQNKVNDSKNGIYRYSWRFNVPIIKWSEAHLNKPSHIKVDHVGKINETDIYKYIGSLLDLDKNHMLFRFRKVFNNDKIIMEQLSMFKFLCNN